MLRDKTALARMGGDGAGQSSMFGQTTGQSSMFGQTTGQSSMFGQTNGQSGMFGQTAERREGEGRLQLRRRSTGPIFASQRPDNVGFRGSFDQRKSDQQDRINTWSESSFQGQGEDVLTSKTGIFGSQAGSYDMRGFTTSSRSRTCSTCSSSSFSSSSSSSSTSSSSSAYSSCSSCSSPEAKGWSSRSPPKELYKYL